MAPIDEVDLRHAVRLARESLAAAPNDYRVRHELACILYRAGNLEESAQLQQEVWAGEPLYRPWAGLWLGMAYSRLGEVEEAEKYLAQAIELSRELTWNPYAILEYDLLHREAESVVAVNSTDEASAAVPAPTRLARSPQLLARAERRYEARRIAVRKDRQPWSRSESKNGR